MNETKLRRPVRDELDYIGRELAAVDDAEKQLAAKKAELKRRLIVLADRHLELEGRSRAWELSALRRRVRLTYPDPTPKVDWDGFAREVGPELFFEVCRVKAAELDVGAWNRAVGEERTRDSVLGGHTEPGKPREPSLYIDEMS